jgi:hypothetical protein
MTTPAAVSIARPRAGVESKQGVGVEASNRQLQLLTPSDILELLQANAPFRTSLG